MKNTVYTLGFKCFKSNNFIAMLKQYNIGTVIDLRNIPCTRHIKCSSCDYSNPNSTFHLQNESILHSDLSRFFDVDVVEANFLDKNYIFDMKSFIDTDNFKRGLYQTFKYLENTSILFLFSEHDPLLYHRGLIFVDYFKSYGYSVVHLKLNSVKDCYEEYKSKMNDPSRISFNSPWSKNCIATLDNYIEISKGLKFTNICSIDE